MSGQQRLLYATSGGETTTGGGSNMEIKFENKTAAFCGKLWQAGAFQWGNHMHATTATATTCCRA